MANSIAFAKNYTGILDEVCKRAAVLSCLNSVRRIVRAGRNAKEIRLRDQDLQLRPRHPPSG